MMDIVRADELLVVEHRPNWGLGLSLVDENDVGFTVPQIGFRDVDHLAQYLFEVLNSQRPLRLK